MKKFIHVLIAAILFSYTIFAQSSGDYRSIANGNWNDATKWEIYNGSNWIAASTYPGQHPGTSNVTIMTEIKLTESVPNPIGELSTGSLAFNAATAVTLSVVAHVHIGELRIDDQIGTKTHNLVIGGKLDGSVYDNFQTINGDDKLAVTFNGYSEVSGGSFQDITFNGSVQLLGDITIAGTATFINGIVSPIIWYYMYGLEFYESFDICFLDGATVSGGSDISYIYGFASKFGIEPFTFPIGSDGVYAPVTISGIAQPEKFYAAYSRNISDEWTITDPDLVSISRCEAWTISRHPNNPPVNPSFDVTVGWTSAMRCWPSSYVSNVAEVVLTTGSTHGGSGTGTTTNGSVTWSGFTGGSITLGNVGTDCKTPSNLASTDITSNAAFISWSVLPGAVSYNVEYKKPGDYTWINAATASLSTSSNLTGLQPATTYHARVRASCGSSSSSYRMIQFTTLNDCGLPSALAATNITSNSANLSWAPAANAINYSIQYAYASSSWYTVVTGITSLSYQFNGLSPLTFYKWKVIAHCSSGTSNYAESYFTTLQAPPPLCNDLYETNNTSSQAKAIPIGSAISAGISSAADVDWFKIITPNNSNTNLLVSLNNLPADYDLYVYNKNLNLIGSSINSGTSNESVYYNSNARKATYYVKVIGKNGAYNISQCYNLLAQVTNGANSALSKSYPANEVTEISEKKSLYPNPASEFVYLNFNSVSEGPVNIQIVNSIGQLVKQHPVNTIKGHNQFKIHVNDIRPGMYILRINKGDLNITRKFVIAR